MSNALLQRLAEEDVPEPVTIYWQGQALQARTDDTIASALLAAGIRTNRKSPSGQAREPFCMMGSCFECLVELEGRIVQGCMEPVSDQMQLSSPSTQEAL
ncbi:MAG: (2Fe-2S)-binding protein [Thiolinea sp.]